MSIPVDFQDISWYDQHNKDVGQKIILQNKKYLCRIHQSVTMKCYTKSVQRRLMKINQQTFLLLLNTHTLSEKRPRQRSFFFFDFIIRHDFYFTIQCSVIRLKKLPHSQSHTDCINSILHSSFFSIFMIRSLICSTIGRL